MQRQQRTKDDHSGCGAASLRHYVAGQTRVVARVGQPRLADDEVVVSTGVDVLVSAGAQELFVFQPGDLHKTREGIKGNDVIHLWENLPLSWRLFSSVFIPSWSVNLVFQTTLEGWDMEQEKEHHILVQLV